MNDDRAIVSIVLSGSRREDARRALRAVRRKFGEAHWKRPEGWIWHHDSQRGVVQLLPEKLHGALSHTGGFVEHPVDRPDAPARCFRSPLPLRGSFPSASERTLRALASQIGADLPEAYRRFLGAHNGGRPTVDAFRRADGSEEVLDRFFAVAPGEYDDVVATLERYAERIPAGHLPVAGDAFGNLILLRLRDGAVFFWDHEIEPLEDEAPDSNLSTIADDFDSFLGSFYDDEESQA